jgi:hypothetical protein
VGTGEHAGVDRDRPNGLQIAPVDSLRPLQHLLAHDAVLDVLQLLVDVTPAVCVLDE